MSSKRVESTQNTKSTDESIIAALDTQYQEAVKNNDVATMDRILADRTSRFSSARRRACPRTST